MLLDKGRRADHPMELISVTVGAVSLLIVAIVALFFSWWPPEAERIRDRLREAEPEVYFTIGSYGGPGGRLWLTLRNRGTSAAYDLALYHPDIEGPAWRTAELPPGTTPNPSPSIRIPLASNAWIRTQATWGLVARLVYHDRYGRRFAALLPLTQESRADGYYDIGAADEGLTLTRPAIRFIDLWRLRNRV
jgi:hypothetical protein